MFSGSSVSILAGSHEVSLTGHLRREYEKENGCDVIIEDGVWLASNSTILGPARIGKNAVVAAGSVVVPDTIIPPNTICGGVPARVIKKIDFGNTKNFILDCLDKHDGVIYGDGWSEEKEVSYSDVVYRGHMLEKKRGKIYTTQDVLKIFYLATDLEVPKLKYVIDGKEEEISIENSGEISFSFKNCGYYPYEIDINKNDDKECVFFVKKGV